VCWTDQQAKHLRRDKLIKVFEQSQTYIEELKDWLFNSFKKLARAMQPRSPVAKPHERQQRKHPDHVLSSKLFKIFK